MPRRSTVVMMILIAVGVLLLAAMATAKIFYFDYYRIPENGMYPGLPAGTLFLTAKRPYADAADVRRGDVIVFVHEVNGKRYNFVWRVVGLPGDKIKASGESLSINGKPVKRLRLRQSDSETVLREQIGDASYEVAIERSPAKMPPDVSMTVPPDHFFVMGDNRLGARDSRYMGPIPFRSIIGKKL
jgi:signal peptidase I